MTEYQVVYTLSDTKSFRLQIYHSIKSLTRFVDKENITFIINPPSKRLERYLSRFGNIYEGSEFYRLLDLPTFKFKIEMCDIDSNHLIFLDCDTIILKDITELLSGQYEFFGREEPCRSIYGNMKPSWDENVWKANLRYVKKQNLSATPYNDGFIIFKNKLHKKIKNEYILFYKMYNSRELESPNKADNMHHNEFALSLAVADFKCRNMTEEHHWFGWRNEMYKSIPYVVHVGTNKSGITGYINNMRKFNASFYSMA